MRIVSGSGNDRTELEIPHATIVKNSPVKEQRAVQRIICERLRIPMGDNNQA